MRHRVVLLTKPAVPGLVKTRLLARDGSGAPVLDPRGAADLHRAFLLDTSATLSAVCREHCDASFSIAWALDSGLAPEPGFECFDGFEQVGGTLGDRLLHALQRDSESGDVVVAVGSDHPELPREVVWEAIEVIASGSADLAIGPAHDGGYYLLAVRRECLHAPLFEGISWSTASVYDETIQRADTEKLRVHQLPAGHDCDTPLDLACLYQRLIEGSTTKDAPGSVTRDWLLKNYTPVSSVHPQVVRDE